MEYNSKINFDLLLEKIKPYKTLLEKDKMDFFLEEIFKDIIMRNELKEDCLEMTKMSFNRFINIPMIVSEKIYDSFKKENNTLLSKNEF